MQRQTIKTANKAKGMELKTARLGLYHIKEKHFDE